MANAVGSQTFSDQGNRASSGTGELVPNDFSPRIVGALVILVMLVSVIVLQLWVFPAVESEDSGPKLMTASTWIHYLTILFTFLVGCLPILGSPNNGTKVTPIGLGVLFAFILSVHGQIIKEKISERTAKLASKTVIEETVQTLNDLRAKAGAIPRLQEDIGRVIRTVESQKMKEQQLLETSESKIDKIFHSVASLTAPRQPKPKKQLSLFFGPGCSGIDDQLDCRRDKSKPAAPAENEQITRNKETQLAEVAEILRQDLSLTLEIRGYASNIGELRDNIAYSQARAFAVASYLANKGIAMTRMSFAGLATAENSRRVDIALFGSAGP